MSCAKPCRLMRSIPAGFILERLAARSMPRRMRAIPGARSFVIFRLCCPSRCKRCLSCNRDRMIRVALPFHLRRLALVDNDVELEIQGPVTQRSVLDALEARYPMLRGTIRDHVTLKRRPFLRFFACEQDLSHEPPDAPLPEAVATGVEPYLIIGAIAGG